HLSPRLARNGSRLNPAPRPSESRAPELLRRRHAGNEDFPPIKARMKTWDRPLRTQVATRTAWRIPTIDQVMIEERAAAFTKRSIKTSAKLEGLKLAISMMDLTTLEGKDTPGK